MITFKFLPKAEAEKYLPSLFEILHGNMSKIAPTGMTYEEDFNEWYGEVYQAFVNKEPRKIILISEDDRLIGYFQYYVNEETFMMEEIQLISEYQGKGVFQKLYSYLVSIIPRDVPFAEAYAHKDNLKSQGILQHLGLKIDGEEKNGSIYHYRGEYRLIFEKYKNAEL